MSHDARDAMAYEILVMFDQTVLATVYLGDSAPGRRSFVLGEAEAGRSPDFAVAAEALGTGTRQLEVARWQDGQLWLELPPAALASAEVQGPVAAGGDAPAGPLSLAALPAVRPLGGATSAVALPAGAEARCQLAGLTLLIRPSGLPERLARPRLLTGMSWTEGKYTLGSVLGHALLLMLLFSVPREARVAMAFEGMSSHRRFVEITVKPPAELAVPEILQGAISGGGGGPPAPGTEGKAGLKESQKTDGAAAVKRRPNQPRVTQLPSRNLRPVIDARQAGLLGILRAERSTLGSVMGATSALGEQAQDAMGNLHGSVVGDARGHDGLGLIGTGTGAGCLVEGRCSTVGSTGLGRYGSLMRPGGRGPAGGFARGAGGLGNRKGGVPTPEVRVQVTPDGLGAEVVRRIIRRHINEVKYCYEKELTVRPELFGRVVLSLLISPAGPVVQSSVVRSTLGHATTESCIASAARRWEFPSSSRATQVTYPFVLQSAGR